MGRDPKFRPYFALLAASASGVVPGVVTVDLKFLGVLEYGDGHLPMPAPEVRRWRPWPSSPAHLLQFGHSIAPGARRSTGDRHAVGGASPKKPDAFQPRDHRLAQRLPVSVRRSARPFVAPPLMVQVTPTTSSRSHAVARCCSSSRALARDGQRAAPARQLLGSPSRVDAEPLAEVAVVGAAGQLRQSRRPCRRRPSPGWVLPRRLRPS